MHMVSYGIQVDARNPDSLKKWINAELPIMKNDSVSWPR